jgi:hypothetical protein
MNALQEAKLKMYRTTESYCNDNTAIIASNVAFQAAFNNFKTNIAAIISTAQADDVPLTGITMDKNKSKQKLCRMTAETAGVIFAYAATVGDNTLKMEVDLTVSDLTRMREDSLAARCQNIHDAGVENLAALGDYGITQDALNSLQTAIDTYSADTPKTRTAISQRKTTTANLAALFDETDTLLKDRLDRLVQIFKAAHPEFVQAYEVTRRVVKPPTTVTQLKGIVTDKTTGAPVKNATVTATPAPPEPPAINDPIPLTALSDAAGEYSFKPLPHDTYTVTVTALGFNNFEADNVDVKLGEINSLDVELVK